MWAFTLKHFTGVDDEASIQRRLATARKEMKAWCEPKFCVFDWNLKSALLKERACDCSKHELFVHFMSKSEWKGACLLRMRSMVPSNGTRPSSALRVTSTVVSRSCAALPRAWHGISDLDGNRKDSHGYGGYGSWELPRIPETFSTK